MNTHGIWTLLPVGVVLIVAVLTHRTSLALLVGTVVGAILLDGTDFFQGWLSSLYGVIGSELWIWLLLLCGLAGGFVLLMQKSGGVAGFGRLARRLCRTDKAVKLVAIGMSILVFIDDWLSILTVGRAMREPVDRNGISRPMLAFLSCTSACCACVLIPISTWGVFMTGQMIAEGVCTAQNGLSAYLQLIPRLFFPLSMLTCTFFYAVGVLPIFGPMKTKEKEAKNRWSRNTATQEERTEGSALDFFLPMTVVVIVTVIKGEILYGIIAGILFCAAWYLPRKRLKPGEFLEALVQGFKDMVAVLILITFAFVLRDINAALGMPEFVISLAGEFLTASSLPLVAFLVVSILGFLAGNFWGITAITFPVILSAARAVGCDLLLASSAVISGIMASCCVCFYGAEATLACAQAEINNLDYAKTVIPMVGVPYGLTICLYIAAGLLKNA